MSTWRVLLLTIFRTIPKPSTTWTESFGPSEEDLAEVPGVGPTIAASVRSFFDDSDNLRVIGKLRDARVNLSGPSPTAVDTDESLPATLEGMAIVVTGTLENYSRRGGVGGHWCPGRALTG